MLKKMIALIVVSFLFLPAVIRAEEGNLTDLLVNQTAKMLSVGKGGIEKEIYQYLGERGVEIKSVKIDGRENFSDFSIYWGVATLPKEKESLFVLYNEDEIVKCIGKSDRTIFDSFKKLSREERKKCLVEIFYPPTTTATGGGQ